MCNKVGFWKKEALSVLNQCKKEHRSEQRIYECSTCLKNNKPCWHLTSEEEGWESPVFLGINELKYKKKWKKLLKSESPT